MAETNAKQHAQPQPSTTKSTHKKLQRLPKNYRIEKRPLLRPAIPSPYTDSQNPKVVYVTARLPFISAVKRVEKLLRLSEKRLVQSATTQVKHGQHQSHGKRKRGAGASGAEEDEIMEVAGAVERMKRRKGEEKTGAGAKGGGEEVVLKGTGKAIQRCLELGLWFQQREEFAVRLVTGSVAAIDDIVLHDEYDEDDAMELGEETTAGAPDDGVSQVLDSSLGPGDRASLNAEKGRGTKNKRPPSAKEAQVEHGDMPETRIRYASTLEVYVGLR